MLREMKSEEITEWAAYYQLKEEKTKTERAASNASARAKRNNR
jgi:hypothetical protein